MCMEEGSHFERTRGACQLGTLPSREGSRLTTVGTPAIEQTVDIHPATLFRNSTRIVGVNKSSSGPATRLILSPYEAR